MSNFIVTTPNKNTLLRYEKYLIWRNTQIKSVYQQLLDGKKKPYPILMELTGLSWQALWKIINYNTLDSN